MLKQAASKSSTPCMNLYTSIPNHQDCLASPHECTGNILLTGELSRSSSIVVGLSQAAQEACKHLPNLEPGLRDMLLRFASTSQRSRGVTRATSIASAPAAGSEKRPAQLSMATTPFLLLVLHDL